MIKNKICQSQPISTEVKENVIIICKWDSSGMDQDVHSSSEICRGHSVFENFHMYI